MTKRSLQSLRKKSLFLKSKNRQTNTQFDLLSFGIQSKIAPKHSLHCRNLLNKLILKLIKSCVETSI